jgi:hypothetical protein
LGGGGGGGVVVVLVLVEVDVLVDVADVDVSPATVLDVVDAAVLLVVVAAVVLVVGANDEVDPRFDSGVVGGGVGAGDVGAGEHSVCASARWATPNVPTRPNPPTNRATTVRAATRPRRPLPRAAQSTRDDPTSRSGSAIASRTATSTPVRGRPALVRGEQTGMATSV